jgi:hypothetical protein
VDKLLDRTCPHLNGIGLDDARLSVGSPGAKLWIKERFEQVPDFYKTYVIDPATPKLDVPRWFEVKDGMAERGAAPYPPEACCVIQLKGNVIVKGEPRETKDRQERARHIQERGWT